MFAGYAKLSNPSKSEHLRETFQVKIHSTLKCFDMASKGDYFFLDYAYYSILRVNGKSRQN